MRARTAHSWAMISALILMGCGEGGISNPNPTPTQTTTELLGVQPAGGATGVPVTGPMMLGFSGPMEAGMEQYIDLHRGTAADPLVPITCTWSADRRIATCVPAQPLEPNTIYTLHVGGGLMDADGHPVDMVTHMNANGGQWYMAGMMGGMHAGMLFPFTTS